MPATPPPPTRKSAGLGTFAGVFTPSILTILGIILFQRLGYIVGAGGLAQSIGIVLLATVISVITSISLAAIASNLRVKGGGDYYLISRTLGAHYGGAIGLVLFIAQSVSVAFYCIGFGEAVTSLLGQGEDARITAGIAAIATVVVLVIAYAGADLATKFQYLVMAALGAALVAFVIGGVLRWDSATLAESIPPPKGTSPFWVLFAIFFPAVTGFTQGVSMSGDLKDPARSLGRGTFLAVGVSTVIYIGAVLLFAAALPTSDLIADYNAMRRISAAPWLIEVGVIAATLSSAMASSLGGPRILQSLAADGVIPPLRPFAAGSGPSNNPRRAVLLAGAVALATIALGNLNVVASVVGMCFLLSYGLLNYATFFEAHANSPAFRPTFKFFNAWLSLAGAGLCVFAGVMISPVAAALAGALMVALHQYLRRTAPQAAWADSRYAYHFRRIREHLSDIREGARHPNDWRPFVLALCNNEEDRLRLLRFASWIDGDSGFTTAVRILTPDDHEHHKQAAERLRATIESAALGTFSRVVRAPSTIEGLSMLQQAHGLGSLTPNTILMSAHEQIGRGAGSVDAPPTEALYAALSQRRNFILLEARADAWDRLERMPVKGRIIDVWWRPGDTARLCLLLAHLMTRSGPWEDASIRVRVMSGVSGDPSGALDAVRDMLKDVRIEAAADEIEFAGPETFAQHSRDAAAVFLPLVVRQGRLTGPRGLPLAGVLERMPVTALVIAGEEIDLDTDTEPEPTAAEQPAPANAPETPPVSDPAGAPVAG